MARVIGGALGNFRGKLGKVAAKIIGGDTILCARPSSFNVSYSTKIVESRRKFKVTIDFASSVSRLPTLHDIWSKNRGPRMTASNMIFIPNFNLSSAQAPTLNNIITPMDGFGSPVASVAFETKNLTSTLAALDSVTNISPSEVNLSINAIVCLSDPITNCDPFYKMISLSKEVVDFNFIQVCNFEIGLNPEEAGLVAMYNQKIVYLAVATKSEDNKVIKYSNTYSLIFN